MNRNQIIDVLARSCNFHYSDTDQRCYGCYFENGICDEDKIRERVMELLKETEWISVKDRLPNCNGCYIVWRPRFYHNKGMPSICYFDGDNTWHDSYGVDFTRTLKPKDVSHWKPLPEQP